jgi:TonB family protein
MRRPASWRKTILGVLIIVVAAAHRAEGQGPEHQVSQSWEVGYQLGEWQKDYATIVADLKQNTPESSSRAKKHAQASFRDVLDRATRGHDFGAVAGRYLIAMAIAEVRLSGHEEGAWHWQMAQNVSAEFRNQDFHDFPDVTAFFKEHLLPARTGSEDLARFIHGEWSASTPECHGPRIPESPRKSVEPRYPRGLAQQHVGGEARIRVVVDTDGTIHEPFIEESSGFLSLDLAVMDALKEWTINPQMCSGRLVPSYYTVVLSLGGAH